MTLPHKDLPHLSLELPPALREKIKDVQEVAVSRSTQTKDTSRLWEFLAFYEGLGIKNQDAFLASEDLLVGWASSYAGQLAERTVGVKLLAIRKEHEQCDLMWQGGNILRQVLKGVEKLQPALLFRTKRAPVTITMLEDLDKGLNRSLGLDICVRAICLLLFFCQLCSGEILPPTQHPDKFNPQRYATFAHIAKSTAENGACNLHLPWSKTQKGRGDDVWIPHQEIPLDPIHALHKHFLKNTLSLRDSITAYQDDQGKLLTLTRSKSVCHINTILRARGKGYPQITGHCFRVGGTTFYLISGVLPDMVKKFRCWHSQAFLEYWHCLDYLGALHIDMLPLNPKGMRK